MINLDTCVKGQKLLLRRGRIATYVYNDHRSSACPHVTRTVEGHYLYYPCDGSFRDESGLDVVEILPLETTDSPKSDKHPSIAWWESCPWITDRAPTEKDGDVYGRVYLKPNKSKVLVANWNNVDAREHWIHVIGWQPPTLTDREQALQLLSDHEDGWRPTPKQWNVIRAGLNAS